MENASIVRCKQCIHRPFIDDEDERIYPPAVGFQPDYTCPYLCESDGWYSRMPEDEWFCNFGEFFADKYTNTQKKKSSDNFCNEI